jgi:hypothetical protein
MTVKAKTPKRYVVWMVDDEGLWYPSKAMPRDEAMDLVARLEHDGEAYVLAPAPEFDPGED